MNYSNLKWCLFIAGGKWQLPLVKFLKEKSYQIILVDPYFSSPCVKIADIHLSIDVVECEKILEEVKDLNITIDFVASDQTDVAVYTVAYLSEKLGLKGNALSSILRFSDKGISRKYIKSLKNGHYPIFKQIETKEEAIVFIKKTQKSAIIKPIDAQSSRGIFKIDNISQLDDAMIADCLSHSKKTYFLIEEFVEGQEITVEGICLNGKHKTLCISDKSHFRVGIASDLFYPSQLPIKLQKKIEVFNDYYVNHSGLSFGLTHAEYIVDINTKKFWLVEHACRGAGTLIPSDIIPWVAGVDLYEFLFQALIKRGVTIDEINCLSIPKAGLLHFFEFENGKIKMIKGENEIINLPFVHRFELEFQIGDIIKNATDDRSRQGYVIILADHPKEIKDTLLQINNLLQVEYEI